MPKRPPKSWWDRCVRGVERSGSARDPESVCGATWFKKMTPAQRRKASLMENTFPLNLNPFKGRR